MSTPPDVPDWDSDSDMESLKEVGDYDDLPDPGPPIQYDYNWSDPNPAHTLVRTFGLDDRLHGRQTLEQLFHAHDREVLYHQQDFTVLNQALGPAASPFGVNQQAAASSVSTGPSEPSAAPVVIPTEDFNFVLLTVAPMPYLEPKRSWTGGAGDGRRGRTKKVDSISTNVHATHIVLDGNTYLKIVDYIVKGGRLCKPSPAYDLFITPLNNVSHLTFANFDGVQKFLKFMAADVVKPVAKTLFANVHHVSFTNTLLHHIFEQPGISNEHAKYMERTLRVLTNTVPTVQHLCFSFLPPTEDREQFVLENVTTLVELLVARWPIESLTTHSVGMSQPLHQMPKLQRNFFSHQKKWRKVRHFETLQLDVEGPQPPATVEWLGCRKPGFKAVGYKATNEFDRRRQVYQPPGKSSSLESTRGVTHRFWRDNQGEPCVCCGKKSKIEK